MSLSAWKWESASCQSDLVERHWLEARRKYVLPVVQRASPVGHGHRRSADGNRRSGNAERRGSDPQSETPMGIGDRPMDFAEAPMAFVEAPTSFGKAPSPRKRPDVSTLDRLLVCYGADVERLGRALKEVRDKRVAKSSPSDPKITAIVKEVLLQLGYPVPDPPD